MSKWSDSDIVIATQKSVPMSHLIKMIISSLADISFPRYREQKYSLDAKHSNMSLWLSHIPMPWLTITQLHENPQTLGHFFEPLYIFGFDIRRSTGMSVVNSRLLCNSQALLYRLYIYWYIGCALLVQCRFFHIGCSSLWRFG